MRSRHHLRLAPGLWLLVFTLLAHGFALAAPNDSSADRKADNQPATEKIVKKTRSPHAAKPTLHARPPLRLELPEGHAVTDTPVHTQHQYPVNLPDLLNPPADTTRKLQVGGSLILNEESDATKPEDKKRSPAQQYLGNVQGAEINVSVKTP